MSVRLGPFEIQTRFASGGMGEIYSGMHVERDLPVAIKVITGPNALVPEYQEEFRREVQAVARLNHPNIVQVYDYGMLPDNIQEVSEDLLPGAPYLVMEYASRGSLATQIDPLNWRDLKNILMSVLGGLSHAHARDVIHRDIKPGNVLLGSYHETPPRIILTDFGVAHAADSQTRTDALEFTARSTEEASGTPRYMAPEQFMGKWRNYGPWTDLYAVGIMAYQMASGKLPFRAGTFMMLAMAHINNEFPALEARMEVPDGFEEWVRRMTMKKPEDRFQSAADASWGLAKLNDSALLFSELSAIADAENSDEEFDDATDMLPTRIDFAPPEALRIFMMSKTKKEDYPDAPALPLTWREAEPPQATDTLVGAGLGLFGLRSIPVVARGEIRNKMWEDFKTVYFDRQQRGIVLRGFAGTGKTRLAEWLNQLACEIGAAHIFTASHGPIAGPMHGLAWMLTSHFRSAGLTAEDMQERVETYLEGEGVDDQTEVSALTEIMRDNLVKEDRTSKFMAFTSIDQRYNYIQAVLQRAAQRRPVIVLLDDVQWSWDTIKFTKHCLTSEIKHPILFVMTVRDEALVERPEEQAAISDLLALEGVSEYFIDPLEEEQIVELVRAHLGLPEDLALDVAQRSGGSPMFAIQLVEDWVKRGVLEVEGTAFVVRSGETAEVPQDLDELWESRIDFLIEELSTPGTNEAKVLLQPEMARKGLELAAALGRDVKISEWLEVCARSGVKIAKLVVDEMIRLRLATGSSDAESFSFINVQLWDALIRSAESNKRWVKHNMVCATTLATMYSGEQSGLAQRIGGHFIQARAFELAVTCLEEAYHRAHGNSDQRETEEILEHLEDAFDAMDVPENSPKRAQLAVRRGVPMIYSDQPERFETGLRLLAKAEKVARASDDVLLLADILRAQAWATLHAFDEEQGLDLINEVLNILPENHADFAGCHRTRGSLLLALGRIDEAIEDFEKTLDLSPDSIQAVWARQQLGECARRQGRFAEAKTLLNDAIKSAAESEILLARADAHESLGLVAFAEQIYPEAESAHQEAFRIREMMGGDTIHRSRSWEFLGRALFFEGEFQKAFDIAETLQRKLESGRRGRVIHPSDLLLASSARLSKWEIWDDFASQALDFQNPPETWHVSTLIDAARTAHEAGKRHLAEALLEPLLERLDEANVFPELQLQITALLDDIELDEELDELHLLDEESDPEVEVSAPSDGEADDSELFPAFEGDMLAEDSEPEEYKNERQMVNFAELASFSGAEQFSVYDSEAEDSEVSEGVEDPKAESDDESSELDASPAIEERTQLDLSSSRRDPMEEVEFFSATTPRPVAPVRLPSANVPSEEVISNGSLSEGSAQSDEIIKDVSEANAEGQSESSESPEKQGEGQSESPEFGEEPEPSDVDNDANDPPDESA